MVKVGVVVKLEIVEADELEIFGEGQVALDHVSVVSRFVIRFVGVPWVLARSPAVSYQ